MSNTYGQGGTNDGSDSGAFGPDYPTNSPYSQPSQGYPEPSGYPEPPMATPAPGYAEPMPPAYGAGVSAYPPAQGYPAPTPYNAAPYGVPPENNLVWGILTTVLCCLPLGIPSIVYATQVNTKWAMGDYAGAQESAKKARQFAMWSAIVGVVGGVLYFGLSITLAALGSQ